MDVHLSGHEDLIKVLKKLASRVSDLRPAFRDMGESLLRSINQRFEDQKTPKGERWKPNSPVTIERKRRRSNKILTDYATMRKSITYKVDREKLQVGTNVKYAINHQLGLGVPKREFMGVSKSEEETLITLLKSHITSAID